MTAAETYTIMELAREFSITPRTIRFYEDKGLLHPARRGNNRVYNRRDRARLMLILRGKRLGFSLNDIRETIDLYDGGNGEQYRVTLEKVNARIAALEQQQKDIDLTLDELRRAQTSLIQALDGPGTVSQDPEPHSMVAGSIEKSAS